MTPKLQMLLALSFCILHSFASVGATSPLLQECNGLLENAWDFTSTSPRCTDVATSILHGSRASFNGPFQLLNCQLQWFEAEEACSILGNQFPHVMMVGESFMRHMNNGLLVVLSGNAVNGSIRSVYDPAEVQQCGCEHQFNDGHSMDEDGVFQIGAQGLAMQRCRDLTAHNSEELSPPICAGNGVQIRYQYSSGPAISNAPRTLYVVGGQGLNTNFNLTELEYGVLVPIMNTMSKEKDDSIVCVTTHAQGPNKPLKYVSTQGNHKVLEFNVGMSEICARLGFSVLDFYDVTRNTTTWDGQHFGLAPNVLKAQILLNWISNLVKVPTI